MLTYILAILAAASNATASVLQRKTNREMPLRDNLRPRLILDLLHRPLWFAGILAVIASFLLQAAALGNGQLAVVEPLLVLELPATLILGSLVFGSRLHRREWGSAVTMTLGLVGLLYFLSPRAGTTQGIPWYEWILGIGINLALIGVMVWWGRRDGGAETGGARQAAVLGAAAGSAFGLTAALMKGMTNTFANGFVALLTSWQVYAMIAGGILAMFLLQSAMNAGRLIAAQPGITLSDPIVSILWGVLIFREQVRGGAYIVLAVAGGMLMVASVVVLSRSPLLGGESGQREEGRQDEGRQDESRQDGSRQDGGTADQHLVHPDPGEESG